MLLLVANPSSRSGVNAGRVEAARAAFRSHGLEHHLLITRPDRASFSTIVQELQSGRYRGVVAMGGDGTFGEVAGALVECNVRVPMGLLATGTGNNQARSFGIPPDDIVGNVKIIAEGHTAPLDGILLEARDPSGVLLRRDWSFDSTGFGLSANILKLRGEDRQLVEGVPLLEDLYRDRWVYAGAVLRAFVRAWVEEERFDATIVLEEGGKSRTLELTDLHDLILKNTRYYASVWVFDATSSPEDGLIEVVPIYNQEQWLTAAVLNHVDFPEPPEEPPTDIFRANAVTLELRPKGEWLDTQIDGDGWQRIGRPVRVEARVRRHALKLWVPEDRS